MMFECKGPGLLDCNKPAGLELHFLKKRECTTVTLMGMTNKKWETLHLFTSDFLANFQANFQVAMLTHFVYCMRYY